MTTGSNWRRSYQVCGGSGCSNWIWSDKVREGYVCRRCGEKWPRPPQGYSKAPASRSPKKPTSTRCPLLLLPDYGISQAHERPSCKSRLVSSYCPRGTSWTRLCSRSFQSSALLRRYPVKSQILLMCSKTTCAGQRAGGAHHQNTTALREGRGNQAQTAGFHLEGPVPSEADFAEQNRLHEESIPRSAHRDEERPD